MVVLIYKDSMAAITNRERTNRKIAEAVTKKSEEIIHKLEEAFSIDASIGEACFYAGIAVQTYYNWIKNDPKLLERLNELRNKPVLLARQRIVKGVNESYSNAMDYLSRKRPQEFGNKQKLEVEAKVLTMDVTQNEAAQKLADEYEEKLKEAIAQERKKQEIK